MDQEKIGKFMAKLRKDKNITQEELAAILRVSSKSISRWETGKCMPDLSLLVPLSKELGISVNDLLSGKKNDRGDYPETFEENIVKIVSKVDKENKRRKAKNIFILLFTIFIVIPLLILCVGQFFKIELFPSFSSFKIMNKANQFYEALKNSDADKIDELMTDDAQNEMCWGSSIDSISITKENFLNNVKTLKDKEIKYTSFKLKLFYYGNSTGSSSGWELLSDNDDQNGVTVSTCSWPSFNNFIVEYELCAENFEGEKACIMIKFQLNKEGKLTYFTETQDSNLQTGSVYKKYYPVYYPASLNNIYYNKMHVFIDLIFRGDSYEDALEGVASWEKHE